MKSKHQPVLVFGLAAFLGALIWLLSPSFAGHREPWDAQSHYYACALLISGFLPACLSAEWFLLSAIGVWLGQTVTFLFLFVLFVGPNDAPRNALWPVGLTSLFLYLGWAVAGAALGAGVNRLVHRFFRHAV